MTPAERRGACDAIWQAMVIRAETLHDHVVRSQARATSNGARKIVALADELSALARAAVLLSAERRA